MILDRFPPVMRLRMFEMSTGKVVGKGRAFYNVIRQCSDIELPEAVKQVASADLPQGGINRIVWTGQGPAGTETAIRGNLDLAGGEQDIE